jgi:hypothetical protein
MPSGSKTEVGSADFDFLSPPFLTVFASRAGLPLRAQPDLAGLPLGLHVLGLAASSKSLAPHDKLRAPFAM